MTPKAVGILSDNQELCARVKDFHPGRTVVYRSFEAVRRDECDILLVDFRSAGPVDSIQFILSKIRKKLHEIPVLLVVSAEDTEIVNTAWFFDDVIVHPFTKGELSLRIRKALKGDVTSDHHIVVGPLIIDTHEYRTYLDGQKLELTYKEFELLRLLAQNRGKVFSRNELLAHIWGVEYIGGTRTVDVHIRRLRIKLGNEFNEIIETVRNVGYRCKT